MSNHPRGGRTALVASLLMLVVLTAADLAQAQMTPIPVLGGSPDQWGAAGEGIALAWSSDGPSNTGPYNAYVRVGSGAIRRVNPAGTQAAAGGLYVNRLVFQQVQDGHAIMRFYNVVSHTHGVLPAAWNRGVWQLDPTFYTHYVLFGRYTPATHRWAILLGDLITRQLKLLASVTGANAAAHAGQVNGDYATWTVCPNVNVGCDVYEYTISTDTTTKLANTFADGAYQYNSSVASNGTVYFFHSSAACGAGVTLNEQVLGQPRTVLVTLATGVGSTLGRKTYVDDSHVIPVVYYSVNRCGTHQDDAYKVVNGTGPSLVKDVWPGIPGSSPGPFTHVPGGFLLFPAFGPGADRELFRTDGTEAGTRLVKDIHPGRGTPFLSILAVAGGIAYLSANDGRHGYELWRSDGTTAGTRLVKDLYPAPRRSSSPHDGFAFAGDIYFIARDANGFERWKSDGTAAGTTVVKGAAPLSAPVTAGGRQYFAAASAASGTELWTSDSRGAGMRMVADINPGPVSSSPQHLVAYDGDVYFQACDAAHGCEVWSSNGTSAGTTLVSDTVPGATGAGFSDGVVMGGILYFVAEDSDGQQLWRTDGTAAGTVRVTDIIHSSLPGADEIPWLRAVAGTLYFEAFDPAHGQELWSTGGAPGTAFVTDIVPGPGSSTPGSDGLAVVDGVLLFSAMDPLLSYELWRADGTAGGTRLVADLNPGPMGSSPSNITPLNGTAIFSADHPPIGYELFTYTP